MQRQDNPVAPIPENKKATTFESMPRRAGEIAMLRGPGYPCLGIGRPLGVSPQGMSPALTRHRRSPEPLRGALQLHSLSARAVNALRRHGVGIWEEGQQASVPGLLAEERNCGGETIDDITPRINHDKTLLPATRP